MSAPDQPFDSGRPRPVATVIDALRKRIDHEQLDGAVVTLEAVAADLGYGDIRPLPGTIAWIDKLRGDDKKVALVASGERAAAALELAGVTDRFDAVVTGPRTAATLRQTLEQLGVEGDRTVFVDVTSAGIAAAREAGFDLAIAIARGKSAPEDLRQSGAHVIVADLQELLGPT